MRKVKRIDIDSTHYMELQYYTQETPFDLYLICYQTNRVLFSVAVFPTSSGQIEVELNVFKKGVNITYVYFASIMLAYAHKRSSK